MKPKVDPDDPDFGDLDTGLLPSLAPRPQETTVSHALQPFAEEGDDSDELTSKLSLPPRLEPPPDPQLRLHTPPLGIPAAASLAPARPPRSHGANRDEVAAPTPRGVWGRVLAGLVKGGLVASMILGSAWIARMATIEEIRQKLAETPLEPADPAAEAAGAPLAAGEADPGIDAPPAEPAPESAPDRPPEAALADPGTEAPPDEAEARALEGGGAAEGIAQRKDGEAEDTGSPEAAPAEERGEGTIVVKGRGRILIDGKLYRAPCSVKVPEGEHVVRTKGGRRFKRTVTVRPDTKAIVRIP